MKKPQRTLLAAALLTVSALAVTPSPAFAAGQDRPQYVALGDSYAAAPLVRPADPANPRCVRSLGNYPNVAADVLGAGLTDVTCSGATARDFTRSAHAGTPPQYDALSADTDLVSITIGANDAELFRLPNTCVNLLPEPLGTSCEATNTGSGTDRYAAAVEAWAPTFDAVLTAVRARAPHARVVVVGYGTYFRPGGCFPAQPYWGRDADYIQARIDQLGTVLREAAARHGALYTDTAGIGAGHDACAPQEDRYIQSALSLRDGFPLHPTSAGSRAFGEAVAATLTDDGER
ncbi:MULTISPECIES: SGNH/GDSL hydrolase family protein [unclassified Streptomyces]|uniref:SGNH/GDSL hydrolase family protein n=1 Tax=unclassified Streptomyces TaxID=2593676 RepID=UPI0004CC34BA|nr:MULTISPECIES: SGNH/GDSL hydrolase family protein [unclassified Streptomyces]